MDLCRKVRSEYQPEQIFSPSCSNLGSLDDLFSGHTTEEDENLEWLSIFVEDCLSSTGNCLPPPPRPPLPPPQNLESTTTNPKPTKPLQVVKTQKGPSPLDKFVIPGKARSKRKRRWGPLTSWSHHFKQSATSDPPLLQQAYWLADSELILPKKEDTGRRESRRDYEEEEREEEEVNNNVNGNGMMGSLEGQPRRCTHCLAQRTPQWRGGPLGPKTLCNACGVRYKSGRLLPEYRPAKSPTFVTYKHSNSHKKVLEMRSLLSSTS